MPKIAVYKADGKMIPVERAKVASAYVCPWTESLFATKRGYVKHLSDLRETRMHSRARRNRWQKKFEDFYNQPTFADVIRWVEINPEFFFDSASRFSLRDRKDLDQIRKDFWVRITYLDLRWSDTVSNSHSCPRGGTTNWGSKDGRPTGYPGWHGNIEFQVSHDIGFGSDVFRGLGINTGTGGGTSNNRYGFEVKFFAADWPGIYNPLLKQKDDFEKDHLLDTIKSGRKPWFEVPGFKWGKPYYFDRSRY